MIEISEILYRWNRGDSKKNICRSLGISRNTVKEIIRLASYLGVKQGISSQERVDEISRLIIEARYNKPKNPNSIQMRLSKRHVQLEAWNEEAHMTITQMLRLLAESGEIVSETSLRTYIRKHFVRPQNVTVHLVTIPGKQAQVDYGYVGMMLDPIEDKQRRTYAFIMTLSHSRHRFVYFVFRQDVSTWIDCHIRAFHFFCGVPETILLDNLKAGVIKPHIYDPTINRSYAELERHYGFVADPAKIRKPEHKGKVERNVTIIRQQILAGRNHKDINAANEYAAHWCRNEVAHRVTRTTGETPWERYIRDEKNKLLALPSQEFERPIWQSGIVHNDHHIVFEGSFYSVATEYISKTVWIRATLRVIKIYYEEQLIKIHIRATKKGQWVTDPKDYPESAREFLAKTPKACLGIAETIGEFVYKIIAAILKKCTITNQRKSQAILRLADQYGATRLNQACKRALEFDNLKYESIKRILDLNLDQEQSYEVKAASSKGAYLRHPNEFATIGE